MTMSKLYQDLQAASGGRVLLTGSFRPNGASGIVAASQKGQGYTVARTSAGLYTITLDDYPGLDLESVFVSAHSEAATGHVNAAAKEVVINSSTDKAFQIEVFRGQQGATGIIPLPLDGAQEADGTALAAFSAGTSIIPGLAATVAGENGGIRWNDHGTPDPIAMSFIWPSDVDTAVNATLKVLAAKTGATIGDATTFDAAVFNHPDAALYDADADYGGTSSAMTGDAVAKTCQEESLTLALANLPAAFPSVATITIQPTDGTLGTDDVILLGAWIEYSKTMELVDLADDDDNVVNFMAILRQDSKLVP